MEKTIVIFMGIQGSGKSTCYEKLFSREYGRINLDSLHTRKNELRKLEELFSQNLNFVVDNTNPTKNDRARYISPAKERGYTVKGYFFESRLKTCIERNNLRSGKARVSEAAIAATSNKLQLPALDEGFDELYFVRYCNGNPIIEEWRE